MGRLHWVLWLVPGCATPATVHEVSLLAPQVAPVSATTNAADSRSSRQLCVSGADVTASFRRLSWQGAYELLRGESSSWPEGDEPSTEAEAKAAVCVTSSGSSAEPPKRSSCGGASWIVSTDHHFFTDRTFVLVPVEEGVVVFDAGLIGGGLCSGGQNSTLVSLDVRPEGSALRLRIERERHTWHEGAHPNETCVRESAEVTEIRWDPSSGRACSTGATRSPSR